MATGHNEARIVHRLSSTRQEKESRQYSIPDPTLPFSLLFGICTAPFLDQRMAPFIFFAVHVTIPPGIIVRDHLALLDVTHGNSNMVDLRPETISHGIPLFPKLMRHKGVDFSKTGEVGLVVARVIGEGMRAGGHEYSLSQVPEPSVEAVTVKGIEHIVKDRIVLFTKLAQLIVQRRWNLKAVERKSKIERKVIRQW
jgi:hypothetical protein